MNFWSGTNLEIILLSKAIFFVTPQSKVIKNSEVSNKETEIVSLKIFLVPSLWIWNSLPGMMLRRFP